MRGRWPWIVGLGLLLASAWGGYRAFDSWRYREGMRMAQAKIASGSPALARRALTEVVGRWPGRGEAEYLLGACEFALGRVGAADAAWARVPPESSFGPHAALMQARSALKGHRFVVAERFLPTALEASGPNGIEARETLIRLYKLQGRYEEARRLVQEGWDVYPDRVGSLQQLWRLDTVDPLPLEDQRSTLEVAAQWAPDDDRIWLGQAHLLMRTGRYDEAARRLEDCRRRRPRDPAIWRSWLVLSLAAQDVPQVRRALRHLPTDRVPPAEVLSLRAWFAAREGDPERERRALVELVAMAPGYIQAFERLVGLTVRAGAVEQAARLRARKTELDRIKTLYSDRLFQPNPVADSANLARWAEALGRWFEARGWWSLASRRDPGNPEAASALGRIAAAERRAAAGPTLDGLLAGLGPAELDGRGHPAPRPAADGPRPDFVDDAEAAGLRFTYQPGQTLQRQIPETMGSGIGLLDFDGDGWLDVYLVQGGPFPPAPGSSRGDGDRLFRNRGDGRFADVTEEAGIAGLAQGYGHGVAVGDFDNDGDPDLFLTRWQSYALYRNKGDGTFEDATEAAGLGGARDWPTSSAFADLDNDGDLDLYVCHYLVWDPSNPPLCPEGDINRLCNPGRFPSLPDRLYRNDTGRFVEVTEEAGIVDTHGRGMGVVAADYDGDGLVDLYVANDQTANFLFRNLGGMRFDEIGHSAGVAAGSNGGYQAGMGVASGDLDGDGHPDLAVTNFYGESTAFYQNLGGGLFSDLTAAIGLAVPTRYRLGFGIAFLDFNNDARLDLATANGHVDDFRPETPYAMPAQLFAGGDGGRLADVTDRAGPAFQAERVGRALAVGDLDNDGRQDMLIVALDGPLAYFRNRTGGGHSVTFRLEGTAANRDAVGARVAVIARGRRRTAWRLGGGSYQSSSDPRLHFGLGEADRVESVEVAWPSGRVDRFDGLPADSAYTLREGDDTPRPLPGYWR